MMIAAAACALVLGAGTALSAPPAGNPTCAEDEIPVPDERAEDAKLCLKKSEWEKAKETCEKNAGPGQPSDPLECICQDADTVGACGD
jgi:hypothetical protein